MILTSARPVCERKQVASCAAYIADPCEGNQINIKVVSSNTLASVGIL